MGAREYGYKLCGNCYSDYIVNTIFCVCLHSYGEVLGSKSTCQRYGEDRIVGFV